MFPPLAHRCLIGQDAGSTFNVMALPWGWLSLELLTQARDVWRSHCFLRTPWGHWRPAWVWNLQVLWEAPLLLAGIFMPFSATFFGAGDTQNWLPTPTSVLSTGQITPFTWVNPSTLCAHFLLIPGISPCAPTPNTLPLSSAGPSLPTCFQEPSPCTESHVSCLSCYNAARIVGEQPTNVKTLLLPFTKYSISEGTPTSPRSKAWLRLTFPIYSILIVLAFWEAYSIHL